MRDNEVAPIIIKIGKEEYQHYAETNEPVISAAIAPGLEEHPLVLVCTAPLGRVLLSEVMLAALE